MTSQSQHDDTPLNHQTTSSKSSIQNDIDALNMQIQKIQLEQQLQQLQQQQKINMIPASFIQLGDKCTAYNKDGLPLDLSFDKCKQYASEKKSMLKKFDDTTQNQEFLVNSH